MEAEPEHGILERRPGAGEGAELDGARLEPLPDLEGAPTGLEVAVERHVVPAPDAGVASVDAPELVAHARDADADVEVQARKPQVEQHRPPLERRVPVEHGAHGRRVGECVRLDELAGGLPGAARKRRARRLGEEGLAEVVVVPAVPGLEPL